MREHRAFRAPGRAGGIKDRRQIVGRARNGRQTRRRGADALGKAAVAARAQTFDRQQAELCDERAHRLKRSRPADRQRRLGVGQKIFELGQRIGDIQRQQHRAGAQAREHQHDHVGRFVDLHGDAVAGLDAERNQCIGRPARTFEQFAIGQRQARPAIPSPFCRDRARRRG